VSCHSLGVTKLASHIICPRVTQLSWHTMRCDITQSYARLDTYNTVSI